MRGLAAGLAPVKSTLRLARASAHLELRLLRRRPFELFGLALVPIQTIAFVAVFRFAGRGDLDIYGVIAPALITLWLLALMVSGELIATERDNQSLESLCAAPGSLSVVLAGRVSVVTVVSLLGLVLSSLTGWAVFGIVPTVAAPGVFAATVVVTAVATTTTALLFCVFFVNARSPRIFQNASTYPFYVLSGVLVPITSPCSRIGCSRCRGRCSFPGVRICCATRRINRQWRTGSCGARWWLRWPGLPPQPPGGCWD